MKELAAKRLLNQITDTRTAILEPGFAVDLKDCLDELYTIVSTLVHEAVEPSYEYASKVTCGECRGDGGTGKRPCLCCKGTGWQPLIVAGGGNFGDDFADGPKNAGMLTGDEA